MGSISQLSSFRFPFVQWKFTVSPHAGLIPALSVVSCFQFPIGPAQSSAGVLGDWRATAETDPSRERAPLSEDCALTDSSPAQIFWTAPPDAETLANPDLPSTFSPNTMRSAEVQTNVDGELLIFGVRLRTVPPATGTVKISPPTEPSSLIRPSMNATCLPSGETWGSAICRLGT